jgi:hypothetical protein
MPITVRGQIPIHRNPDNKASRYVGSGQISYCDGLGMRQAGPTGRTEPAKSGSIASQQRVTGPGNTWAFTRSTITELLAEIKAVKALAVSVYQRCKSLLISVLSTVLFPTPRTSTRDDHYTPSLLTWLKCTKSDASQILRRWNHTPDTASMRRRSRESYHWPTSSSGRRTKRNHHGKCLNVHAKSLSGRSAWKYPTVTGCSITSCIAEKRFGPSKISSTHMMSAALRPRSQANNSHFRATLSWRNLR